MIVGKQIAAARALLGISQDDLALKSGVGVATIIRFERGESDPRTEIRDKLKFTLETLGVEFKEGGVVPRKSMVQEMYGIDAYDKLEDEIFEKVKDTKGEILLFGIDEAFANENTINHAKRLQENHIYQKLITHLGAKTGLFPKEQYRFLGEDLFSFTPFVVYENNLAIVYPDLASKVDHIIIIRNKSLAETFKKLFNHLWKIGKKER